MKKTIEEYWLEYAKVVGQIQCKETEIAFYAGMNTLMNILHKLGKKEASENECGEILQNLNKEMNDWIKNNIMQTTH